MTFHCIVVRKGVVKKELHGNSWDLARRKHFTVLLINKMKRVLKSNFDRDIEFRIYVDPIASSYDKADEVIEIISNHTLNKELGQKFPVESVITRDSKETPTIQLCDFFLGAVMEAFQQKAESESKKKIQRYIAEHLGWTDLHSDTRPNERKFNIWYFHDVAKIKREIHTRDVNLKYQYP